MKCESGKKNVFGWPDSWVNLDAFLAFLSSMENILAWKSEIALDSSPGSAVELLGVRALSRSPGSHL